MSQTAVALVAMTADGKPMSGVIAHLKSNQELLLFDISNLDGYMVFDDVPMPFIGTVKLAGSVQFYEQPVSINGNNVTLRVGPSPSNPQDIQLPPCVPFKHGSALPAPPSRDQLCGVKCSFQGLTVKDETDTVWPWFEPALAWPAFATMHNAVYDVKAEAGDTHVNIAVSSQYNEPYQAYAGIEGRDLSEDLPALRALITEIICAGYDRGLPNGFMVLLAMAGDGMAPDPVGLTKGWDWLMQNFSRIWTALRGDNGEGPDLTPWVLPMPGYDGVVPAWQPFTLVNRYVQLARAVVGPIAPLAIELSAGYNSWSGEANDWATADGQMFDVILQEFPYPMGPPAPIPPEYLDTNGWKPNPPVGNEQRAPFDQVWQIVGAMIQPFNRPANMPANDYPGGIPYRLSGGTPRGPFHFIAWEFDTYGWVRYCPLSQVQAHRAYLQSLGCQWVG